MIYQELFLLNNIPVVHPNRRIPTKLCPRDEVAHPEKLVEIVSSVCRNWRPIRINGQNLYYLRSEYDRAFYDNVVSSHLYVLTDHVSNSMFYDANRVRPDSFQDMFDFLQRHAYNLFAITTPVFTILTEGSIPFVYYTVPVHNINAPVYLPLENVTKLRDMLNSRCYTVCNGLTLFLAMVRAREWGKREALAALVAWQQNGISDNEPIGIPEIWHELHVSHPVPMISDFPSYYAAMHPPVPRSFLDHVKQDECVPISQLVDDTDTDDIRCIYASPLTAMYPYFNSELFHYYNREFLAGDGPSTSTRDTVFDTPFEIDEDDMQLIDVEGFLIGILRSRRAWRWWLRHGPTYLRKLHGLYKPSQTAFVIHIMQVLFYLYTRPYVANGIKYSRTKVRSIWHLVLTMFDVEVSDIRLLINITTVRSLIYNRFAINRWNPPIPMSFMIDVMSHYKNDINWFANCKNKIFTVHAYDMKTMAELFGSYISVCTSAAADATDTSAPPSPPAPPAPPDAEVQYSLRCSIYQLLKLEQNGRKFVEHVLDKHLSQKLLCIDRIFGMKDTPTVLAISPSNAYEIGILLKEYLRDNRNSLV